MPDQGVDFLKGSDRDIDSFDLPYDYKSIMHYPRWAFSKNGQPTITAKVLFFCFLCNLESVYLTFKKFKSIKIPGKPGYDVGTKKQANGNRFKESKEDLQM